MSGPVSAAVADCERQLVALHDLLTGEDPDPVRIAAAVDAIRLPETVASVDDLAVLRRCRDLHAAIMVQAQSHRDRLAAALVRLDRTAAAIRRYGASTAAAPRFIDRNQ